MDPITILGGAAVLLLAYGIVAIWLAQRVPPIGLVLGALLLTVSIAIWCARYMTAMMPPGARIIGLFIRAYLLLFGIPGLSVGASIWATRRSPSPKWSKVAVLVVLFAAALLAGVRLSANVVEFVNASG